MSRCYQNLIAFAFVTAYFLTLCLCLGMYTHRISASNRYIQAATSPKDIVILLDVSGSMKGLRMEIAKATVEKILETLSDDDFFNVIKVTTNIALNVKRIMI